jgi:regulator of sirC expression with transglutaminase-like and TPR domain
LLLGTERFGKTAWNLALDSGQIETLQKLREFTEQMLTTEELNEELLGTEKFEWTAWHLAATSDNSETLQKVYQCAKEKLTREEINKMLLSMYK